MKIIEKWDRPQEVPGSPLLRQDRRRESQSTLGKEIHTSELGRSQDKFYRTYHQRLQCGGTCEPRAVIKNEFTANGLEQNVGRQYGKNFDAMQASINRATSKEAWFKAHIWGL